MKGLPDMILRSRFILAVLAFVLCLNVHAANPQVDIKTNMGNITVELYPEKAPQTVANFLRYVNDGFYNGTVFHRVIKGFMVQGGGFTADLKQKPPRDSIPNEAANGLKNEIGMLAMARTPDPHSASSQFFINVADNTRLNYSEATQRGFGYCVFGKVVAGMDVVERITALPTGAMGPFSFDVPTQVVTIERATVSSTRKPAQ